MEFEFRIIQSGELVTDQSSRFVDKDGKVWRYIESGAGGIMRPETGVTALPKVTTDIDGNDVYAGSIVKATHNEYNTEVEGHIEWLDSYWAIHTKGMIFPLYKYHDIELLTNENGPRHIMLENQEAEDNEMEL